MRTSTSVLCVTLVLVYSWHPCGSSPVSNTNLRFLREVTIHKATPNSKTFALVDTYDCRNTMMATVRKFFKANKALIDLCISESKYQIYPFTGILPNGETVAKLVQSNACMSVISAIVWLNTPPCMIDGLAMRAACETLLYYSEELKTGDPSPPTDQFDQLLTWRRDVELAKEAKKPFDKTSDLYGMFTNNVREALTASKVSVLPNATILIDGHVAKEFLAVQEEKEPTFTSTNSSMDFFVGRVVATDNALSESTPVATTYKMLSTRNAASPSVARDAIPFLLPFLFILLSVALV